METIKSILSWLKTQPVWLKALAIMLSAAAAVIVLFSSCSTVQSVIPNVKDNTISAEGVVSKEKNVSRQTKWFYTPESNLSKNE